MIFDPDDFADDPYTAGINQIGHMVFGAALASIFWWWAGLIVIAWEGWQLRKRGALKSDYWADWFFWTFGIAAYSWYYFHVVAIILGGVWMFLIWVKYDDIG